MWKKYSLNSFHTPAVVLVFQEGQEEEGRRGMLYFIELAKNYF